MIPCSNANGDNSLNNLHVGGSVSPRKPREERHASDLIVTAEWLSSLSVQDITYWISSGPTTVSKVCACFQSWVQEPTLTPEQLKTAKKVLDASRCCLLDAASFDRLLAVLQTHLTHSRDADLQEFLKAKARENSAAANTALAFKFYEVLAQTNPTLARDELHYACENGDLELIRTLDYAHYKHFILHADANGFSPLHLAVKNGHTQLVEFLLGKIEPISAYVDKEPCPDYTDLVSACVLGDQNVISCYILVSERYNLLRQTSSASLNTGSSKTLLSKMLAGHYPREKSLVHAAIEANQINVASQLLAAGADPTVMDRQGRRPLELLSEHYNLNAYDTLAHWKPAGWTLMQTACTWGIDKLALHLIDQVTPIPMDAPEVVSSNDAALTQQKMLAETFVQILTGRQGSSLLEVIPEEQRVDTSHALLEAISKKHGPFVALMTFTGMTFALGLPELEAVGVPFFEKSFEQVTPGYIYRIEDQHFLDVLGKWSLPEDQKSLKLDKTLVCAILHAYPKRPLGYDGCTKCIYEKIKLLLNSGASAQKAMDVLIEHPFPVTAIRDYLLCVSLVLEHGADVNAVGENGNTLLHCLIATRQYNYRSGDDSTFILLLDFLLRKGARVDIPNAFGYTVFDSVVSYEVTAINSSEDAAARAAAMSLLFNAVLQGSTTRAYPYFLNAVFSRLQSMPDAMLVRILNSFNDQLEYAACPINELMGPGFVSAEHENLTFADYLRVTRPDVPMQDAWIRAHRGASTAISSCGQQSVASSSQRFAWNELLCDEQTAMSGLEEIVAVSTPTEIIKRVDERNNTLLHKACEKGYVDFACRLLVHFPQWDLDARNQLAQTPLMVLLLNHPQKAAPFVKLAAERGALLTAHSPNGRTLLNGLIKSYSEADEASCPGSLAGIDATFTAMLDGGARADVFDRRVYPGQRVNIAHTACLECGLDKTRPLFNLIKKRSTDSLMWSQLRYYISNIEMPSPEAEHRLNIAAILVKEAELAEVTVDAFSDVTAKLKLYEESQRGEGIDCVAYESKIEALKAKWAAFTQMDAYDKYGYAINEITAEGVKGRLWDFELAKAVPFSITSSDAFLMGRYIDHFNSIINYYMHEVKSEMVTIAPALASTAVFSFELQRAHSDCYQLTLQLAPLATEDIDLDPASPASWWDAMIGGVGRLKRAIKVHASKTRSVKQLFNETPRIGRLILFQEPAVRATRVLSPGPYQMGIYTTAGKALFFSGNYVGLGKRQFAWERLKASIKKQSSFKGVYKEYEFPLSDFKERWEDFLQMVPYYTLKEGRWKDPLTFMQSIAEHAPDLSPLLSGLVEVDCGIACPIEYSNVDIKKGTLSVQLKPIEGSRIVDLNNVPFWALIDRLSLYSAWQIQIQADNIHLEDKAYVLTETSHVELVVEDGLDVDIDLLQAKFDSCVFEKDAEMQHGITQLIAKVSGKMRVVGDHGEAGTSALREAQKKLKKLIHVFDDLPAHDKPPILSELARVGEVCLPEIDKGLKDVLKRWIYHTPVDVQMSDCDLLLARSLDKAKRKTWYDKLGSIYGRKIQPDTHVVTHFANWLTSDPQPMQLPTDLMTHVNRADYYNEGIAREKLGSTEALKTEFAVGTRYHLPASFIELFEEMSTSQQEADGKAISSILDELRKLAFERGSPEERADLQALADNQQREAVGAAAELERLNTAVEKARVEGKGTLKDYRRAKEALTILRAGPQYSDHRHQGKILGKKRKAEEQINHTVSHRKLNPAEIGEDQAYVEVQATEHWPDIIHALEQKVERLEGSLHGLFELEREAEGVKTEYEALVMKHENALLMKMERILEKANWIKADFEIENEVQRLSPGLNHPAGPYPTMSVSYEAALALLHSKGVIRSEGSVSLS